VQEFFNSSGDGPLVAALKLDSHGNKNSAYGNQAIVAGRGRVNPAG
jgi:hypothetical protein